MPHTRRQLTYIGGPTALLDVGGVRLLTDPTFDPAGGEYATPAYVLRKTQGPAVPLEAIGPIDAVLLSHDHHFDNLDTSGREMLARVPVVLTTEAGAQRLGFAITTAVLFMGAARVAAAGPWPLTFTGAEGVEAARAFGAATIVPVHFEGWEHFTESREAIQAAFAQAGLEGRLCWAPAGRAIDL